MLTSCDDVEFCMHGACGTGHYGTTSTKEMRNRACRYFWEKLKGLYMYSCLKDHVKSSG